ncbi:hypothetical protein QBC37DRAFT_396732 [Rhypophila decipiens]|uniref:Transposase n=1 Tax=Rhypophila decipiens TaxID=261697 RepID=A0AAN6YGE5_9PEZI|nr:hypothetical protein QBC37DRAFT_396732 [Rhypophila decipiens]
MPAKSSRLEYSPHKRGIIYQQYKRGYKFKNIAALNDVKPLSIPGIISRYESQFKGRSKYRPGRPPLLNSRDLRHLFRLIDEDPFISTENLIKYGGLTCSPRTLTRALKKHGIQPSGDPRSHPK